MAYYLKNLTRLGALPQITSIAVRNQQKFDLITRGKANIAFFNKYPATYLWTTTTSVSSAGRKRGRAKTINRSLIKDFNKGQMLGVGKANIRFPGLSAPVFRGQELVQQQKLPEDPGMQERLNEIRSKMGKRKRLKQCPLERGYSGGKLTGRHFGPPNPVNGETFDGFDTILVEHRPYSTMKKVQRKRWVSAMIVMGNGKGIVGFAVGKHTQSHKAIAKARHRCTQRLLTIQVFENHTVMHHFFTQFGRTKIVVYQKPPGYGLVAHRAIRSICQMIGIKDIYARIEGSTNVIHVVKAFFLGLLKQKSHQQIANEKGLHLVEMCRENYYYPRVLASPEKCRTVEEIDKNEVLDYEQYCFDGRVRLRQRKQVSLFTKLWTYERFLKKQEHERGEYEARINLLAEHGELRSHLTDEYPECKPFVRKPKAK